MIQSLLSLIEQAKDLASDTYWVEDGGRSCPIGWEDCSQPVYRSRNEQFWDYGEKGGPGHQWCSTRCPHGMVPPEEDHEILGEYVPDKPLESTT